MKKATIYDGDIDVIDVIEYRVDYNGSVIKESIVRFDYQKLEKTLTEFFYDNYVFDENVDLLSIDEELNQFKKTGLLSLAYTTCNDDIFQIQVTLDMNNMNIAYSVLDDSKIYRNVVLATFSNESNLLSLIKDFDFDTLVDCDQSDLIQYIS